MACEVVPLAGPAAADPLRLRADAIGEARAPAGLIVMQGQDRAYPWFDAEALVWGGARSKSAGASSDATADLLVLSLRLREPHGYGEVRGGRFVVATGAVRPIQIDGASAIARAPWGLTLEAFGGSPVAPRAAPDGRDSLWGGRMAQGIASRGTLGVSYVQQRSRAGVGNEEVGGDLAAMPTSWLDLAARGAYDFTSAGIADALASAAARLAPVRLEVFATYRSPSRLLPATSLFSVLGDFPSQVLGAAVRWAAAPRLDLLATGGGQNVGGELGGYGSVRGTLRFDDRGDGSMGVEMRRQDVLAARFTGVRLVVAQLLGSHFRLSTELEVARTDASSGGNTYPWGLVALAWRSGTGWEVAAATEAGATPKYRSELNGLLRVSRTFGAP